MVCSHCGFATTSAQTHNIAACERHVERLYASGGPLGVPLPWLPGDPAPLPPIFDPSEERNDGDHCDECAATVPVAFSSKIKKFLCLICTNRHLDQRANKKEIAGPCRLYQRAGLTNEACYVCGFGEDKHKGNE